MYFSALLGCSTLWMKTARYVSVTTRDQRTVARATDESAAVAFVDLQMISSLGQIICYRIVPVMVLTDFFLITSETLVRSFYEFSVVFTWQVIYYSVIDFLSFYSLSLASPDALQYFRFMNIWCRFDKSFNWICKFCLDYTYTFGKFKYSRPIRSQSLYLTSLYNCMWFSSALRFSRSNKTLIKGF